VQIRYAVYATRVAITRRSSVVHRRRVFYRRSLLPHGGAIEMDHHPFARVERHGVRVRDAGEPVSELGTYERCSRVRGVHVEPHVFCVA